MMANIAILDNMEYWPKPLHPSLEFLYQDRQKKTKTYHWSFRPWWVWACWRTIPLWRLSRRNHGRTRRRVDRVQRRIDWVEALQVSREIMFREKCTNRRYVKGPNGDLKCTRTLTAAGGGPVHCPGPASPPGGGWIPGFYMDAQTRTGIKTPSVVNNLQCQQYIPCLGCSPDDRPAKR